MHIIPMIRRAVVATVLTSGLVAGLGSVAHAAAGVGPAVAPSNPVSAVQASATGFSPAIAPRLCDLNPCVVLNREQTATVSRLPIEEVSEYVTTLCDLLPGAGSVVCELIVMLRADEISSRAKEAEATNRCLGFRIAFPGSTIVIATVEDC